LSFGNLSGPGYPLECVRGRWSIYGSAHQRTIAGSHKSHMFLQFFFDVHSISTIDLCGLYTIDYTFILTFRFDQIQDGGLAAILENSNLRNGSSDSLQKSPSFVLWWGFQGRRIEWRYFPFDQVQ